MVCEWCLEEGVRLLLAEVTWPWCSLWAGRTAGKAACKTERLRWRAVGPLCLPNHLFPQQFPCLVFFSLLKFNLAGGEGEVSLKDISVVEEVSLLGSLFACSCRDNLD